MTQVCQTGFRARRPTTGSLREGVRGESGHGTVSRRGGAGGRHIVRLLLTTPPPPRRPVAAGLGAGDEGATVRVPGDDLTAAEQETMHVASVLEQALAA